MIPVRTWTDSLNNTLQAGSQDAQAQDYMFRIKEALKNNGGWSVRMSQTSTTVSTATDTWVAYTDVTVGATATGAWTVLRSPAGWLTGGAFIEIFLSMNDATSPRNTIRIDVLRNGNYVLPGVANTIPTTTGGSNSTTLTGTLITNFAAATAIDARLAVIYDTLGNVFILFRASGDSGARQMFAVYSNRDGVTGGGFGGQRFFVANVGGLTSANVITWTGLQSNLNVASFTGDGVTLAGAGTFQSIAAGLGNWATGAEAVGGIPACPIQLACNSSSVNQNRDLGPLVDIFGLPLGASSTTNMVQDFDTNVSETKRLRACGVLWWPITRANTFP